MAILMDRRRVNGAPWVYAVGSHAMAERLGLDRAKKGTAPASKHHSDRDPALDMDSDFWRADRAGRWL
jgi:hypothetical protein